MSDIREGFNQKLDKITERECVYDIVTRLSIGKDFTDYNDESVLIFHAGFMLKNILRRLAMALPTSIAHNLETINTTYKNVAIGDTTVEVTTHGEMLLAYSERMRTDLSKCFTKTSSADGDNTYVMTTDVPYSNTDIIKFYSK